MLSVYFSNFAYKCFPEPNISQYTPIEMLKLYNVWLFPDLFCKKKYGLKLFKFLFKKIPVLKFKKSFFTV